MVVNAPIGAIEESRAQNTHLDIEEIFRADFVRIARLIARIVRDPARSEELAVEVFLKLWRSQKYQDKNPEAWLYRTAVRMGLDELRRQTRRTKYEHLLDFFRTSPTPEEICAETEEQRKVRSILNVITPRQAELLILRSQGLSYEELSAALDLNLASIGTLLSRAQQAFRREYTERYGDKTRSV